MEEIKEAEGQFKVPLNISKVNDIVHKSEAKTNKSENSSGDVKNYNHIVLPYEEPSWSGIPPTGYYFEVLKSGVIVCNVQIQKSYLTIGRLTSCDITLEHPSVSRYHAIIQYCKGSDTHPKGFYVYDLTSTHGTFLNKEQISPKTYYMVKVGHVVKFGGSTRLFILNGPEDDEEMKVEPPKPDKITNEEICTWGMAEDAEEDEDDLSVNPFAISTENEDLYIDDPKKTLRGWFEREGYELEYITEEKGFQSFTCKVQLPIDTPTGDYVTVESMAKNKKKEAVIACALEACRTLDRHGLLRQSHHSSRERKKKNWEDEDFYDSDEDTYLDRTGTIEKKRKNRMQQVKKSQPETFKSLEKKLQELNDKIQHIENKINSDASGNSSKLGSTDEDPLDSYMCGIQHESVDKVTKSRLKLELIDLNKEKSKVEKLLNIVKPATLPPRKFPNMIGKRLKSKLKLPPSDPVKLEQPETEDIETEEKEDESSKMEEKEDKSAKIEEKEDKSAKIEEKEDKSAKIEEKESENVDVKEVMKKKEQSDYEKKLFMPLPQREKVQPADVQTVVTKESKIEVRTTKSDSPNKESKKHEHPQEESGKLVKKSRSSKKEKKDVYDTSDDKYSMWLPPSNQTGDGSTYLNLKYGY